MKRVYHPRANSWQDVPNGDVEKWTKAGWKTSPPAKFDRSEEKHIEVGETYTPPETIGLAVPNQFREEEQLTQPGGNASTEEWKRYALAQGASAEDLEGKSRADLQAEFGTQE